jgi:hypothetical protein
VLLCHGSPVRLEEFEYIFAPEQARECLAIWDKIGHITLIGHSHLCKVFALTPSTVEELPSTDFDLEPDKKYIVSVGSVGPAARLRQPRELHGLRHRQEALRVQANRVRHRARGRQGAARSPRAKLRASPLHRRLNDLAAPLNGPAFFEGTHFSGFETTGAHANDRSAFAVCRLSLEEDDIKAVSLFSIRLARGLFDHDVLFSVAHVES